MRVLKGKPVSPGFAEGIAVVYGATEPLEVPRYRIVEADVEREQRRFDEAVTSASRKLQQVREWVLAEFGQPQAEIFSTHLMLLHDRYFGEKVKQRIAQDRINAEEAIQEEIDEAIKCLAGASDEYFRDRGQDIRDIGRRLLHELLPQTATRLRHLPPQSVVVAHELLPSDTVGLDRTHLAGIVTERGGATAHTAILARSLGIPAVTGVEGALSQIVPGARLLVDGVSGEITVDPDPRQQLVLSERKRDYDQSTALATAAEREVCMTRDGVRIFLYGNIRHPVEAAEVVRHHLDGVGLFRTEFMFLDAAEPPGFARQLDAYEQAADALGDLPLVIRTLDLGGDKVPVFLARGYEGNPRMGVRGLRFSLSEARELFQTQLSAIIEAAQKRNIRILLPMVLGGDDLAQAIALVRSVAGPRKVPPIGAMVETPSSLYLLDEILAQADFVSIGTNDLTQFMLAADRGATNIVDVWSVLHPSVLRAVAQVGDRCCRLGKPVAICGEAAGEPDLACLLVGLGLRELSVSPTRAGRIRLALRERTLSSMERTAREVLKCRSIDEARTLLDMQMTGAGCPGGKETRHDRGE